MSPTHTWCCAVPLLPRSGASPQTLIVRVKAPSPACPQVYSGGLSSYSVVNMLIGHLQREGHGAVHAAATAHASSAALPQERALAASLAALLAQTSGGRTAGGGAAVADLGLLLLGFFDLYGKLFQCVPLKSYPGLSCSKVPQSLASSFDLYGKLFQCVP